jgi:hypothetical protein
MESFRRIFCRWEGFEHVCRFITGLIISPNKTLQGIYDCHPDFAQEIGYRLSKNKESIGRISRENEPFPLTVFRPSEAQWSHSTGQEVNDEANSY